MTCTEFNFCWLEQKAQTQCNYFLPNTFHFFGSGPISIKRWKPELTDVVLIWLKSNFRNSWVTISIFIHSTPQTETLTPSEKFTCGSIQVLNNFPQAAGWQLENQDKNWHFRCSESRANQNRSWYDGKNKGRFYNCLISNDCSATALYCRYYISQVKIEKVKKVEKKKTAVGELTDEEREAVTIVFHQGSRRNIDLQDKTKCQPWLSTILLNFHFCQCQPQITNRPMHRFKKRLTMIKQGKQKLTF